MNLPPNIPLAVPVKRSAESVAEAPRTFRQEFRKRRLLYLMLIPAIIYFFIYRYLPLFGVLVAFTDYDIIGGVFKSPWVGLKYFRMLFADPYFWRVLRNTLIISIYKLVWGFPAPIILALLFNELRSQNFKRVTQSLSYLPNFLSWVILYGLFYQFLYRSGLVNNVIIKPLLGHPIDFFGDSRYFRSLLVITDVWKNVGWGTIIYLAALAGINPELYEAASIDGAGKWKQALHITLPGIRSVISITLILSMGGILRAGFEQVLLMQNPLVFDVGDIIDTFTYRVGLVDQNYSYSAAVGLFQSVTGMLLVLGVNRVTKQMGQEGIW